MCNFIRFHSLCLGTILKGSLMLWRDFSDSGLKGKEELLQNVIRHVTRAKWETHMNFICIMRHF